MAVIAVSRKWGSFGDEIAALVADKLKYNLVSREQIFKSALECDDKFRDACAMFETEAPSGMWERSFFRDPSYTSLFEALNYGLAAEGNVVILGRGAQIVLAGVPGVFRVRIVAPADTRVRRISEREGLSLEEAHAFVQRYDQQRRKLVESVFNRDLSDWSLYDLVVNTEGVSRQTAAMLIELAVREMDAPEDWSVVRESMTAMSLAKMVESAIRKHVVVSPYHNLWVTSAKPGDITLQGYVQDRRGKDKALSIASNYPGVASVENKLKTTDLSFGR